MPARQVSRRRGGERARRSGFGFRLSWHPVHADPPRGVASSRMWIERAGLDTGSRVDGLERQRRSLPTYVNSQPCVSIHAAARMMVPEDGFEPPRFGLQNRCSTAELLGQSGIAGTSRPFGELAPRAARNKPQASARARIFADLVGARQAAFSRLMFITSWRSASPYFLPRCARRRAALAASASKYFLA